MKGGNKIKCKDSSRIGKIILISLMLLLIPAIAHSYQDTKASIELKSKNVSIDEGLDIKVDIEDGNGRIDVPLLLEYLIKDSEGYVLLRDLQTKIVNSNATVFKKIYLYPSMKPGGYELIVNIEDGNKTVTKITMFSVYNQEKADINVLKNQDIIIPIFIVVILVLIIITLLVLIYIEKLALERIHKKHKERKTTTPAKPILKETRITAPYIKVMPKKAFKEDVRKELGKQIGLLNSAYRLKLISRDTYEREKKKIMEYHKRLDRKA